MLVCDQAAADVLMEIAVEVLNLYTPPTMSITRSFSDIAREILSRMKEHGRSQYRIAFDPPEGANRTATGETPLRECMIEFAEGSPRSGLTLNLAKKP
jgi:hypothetical protein